jgi:hypothetical protein
MSFQEALQGWHDFYLTAGAASATLAGLLFVGLSLHLRIVVTHPEVRSLARPLHPEQLLRDPSRIAVPLDAHQ